MYKDKNPKPISGDSIRKWGLIALVIFIPWMLYTLFTQDIKLIGSNIAETLENTPLTNLSIYRHIVHEKDDPRESINHISKQTSVPYQYPIQSINTKTPPVLGPIPTNGMKPLFGFEHTGADAIFSLGSGYKLRKYRYFIGSLRKAGFTGDIVVGVSSADKFKPGVEDYLRKHRVISYPLNVTCSRKDNCRFNEDFLGYPDPRPYRTFANIRYALYEYWLNFYPDNAYILILDFRDTFFQGNPFGELKPLENRPIKYDLRLYEENYKVKSIEICPFNRLWIERCFSPAMFERVKKNPVLCSGSTLGSVLSIRHYIYTMLTSMDTQKCWLKGIESDQGYHNALYYTRKFDIGMGKAVTYRQGEGIVNTIGALNGFRVSADMKYNLSDFTDKEGYILNNDGTRSACVHQWDRWGPPIDHFIDTVLVGDY